MNGSKTRVLSVALALLPTLLLVAVSSRAATWHIKPDGTGDFPTIADGLAAAVAGDEIILAPGTFHEYDLRIATRVDIRGEMEDPALTVVDAGGLGRCFDASGLGGGLYSALQITGITLANGSHDTRGGLLDADGTWIRMEHCILRSGAAPRGGGVYARYLHDFVRFVDCVFEDCSADLGGALYGDGTISVYQCVLRRNTARQGGAVYAHKRGFFRGGFGSSTFEENEATETGGAIHSTGDLTDEYTTTLAGNCEFVRNRAASGGAARLSGYDTFRECSFVENEATFQGGAILFEETETPEEDSHQDNLFVRNTAGVAGGAAQMNNSGGYSRFYQNTWVANDAPAGAHINVDDGGSFNARGDILAFGLGGGSVSGDGNIFVSCTDVFGNVGGDWVAGLAGQDSGRTPPWANFSENPLFCDAAHDDFTLSESSPCFYGNNPEGVNCYLRIGAFGSGCGPVSVDSESWGRIKARYRDESE